jgi:hypothetical protein
MQKIQFTTAALIVIAALSAITGANAQSSTQAAVPPALIPVPLKQAVEKAANALLSVMPEAKSAPQPRDLVIDPLIDGYTGAQNTATRKMGGDITRVVKQNYAGFSVVPFTSATITKQPLLLIGTFRLINAKNDPAGPKDVFHICLALLDLKSGKVVSKGVARAFPEGVDITPTSFFQDSPLYTPDPAISGYIKSCQATKAGDPIDQAYADRILVASLISDAIKAYEGRRYRDAIDLYKSALRTPGGDQLRVYNGIYLANWRLRRAADATAAFGTLVDYGLKSSKIGVAFLFTPNSTIFFKPREMVAPYEMWLKVIGEHGTAANSCLEIVGHTSRTGPTAINERLSVLRAQYVRDHLISIAPRLENRTIATGVGSREVIVGTDTDGPVNALDRRVEFKTIKCSGEQSAQHDGHSQGQAGPGGATR